MRVLRDCQDVVSILQRQIIPPTAQLGLEAVGELSDEREIHCLILVSFGLQVFLFFASGLRRRSTSRPLRMLLLWLAYLSAGFVAIFVLGHLALHPSGPQHQLLFFWTPFVLLHLGGQDTITAFSMQDNELWRRHLLGLVTQVAAASYVVSRTSWPDRWLLAAMVLVFLSGCFKYVECTLCLYKASPEMFRETSLSFLRSYVEEVAHEGPRYAYELEQRFSEMLNTNGRQNSPETIHDGASLTTLELVSDPPVNDIVTIKASEYSIRNLLQELKSNQDRYRVYNYVSTRLVLVYESLYTKARLHLGSLGGLHFILVHGIWKIARDFKDCRSAFFHLLVFIFFAFHLLFPVLSTMTALMLFKVSEKGELYSRADVTVSYILLIGAIILEVSSIFVSILSYVSSRDICQSARKQWSEMLGQYNMIISLSQQDTTGIMSCVPQWICNQTSRITISEDLKRFILDKLLDFGTREQDWNFASFRGQLALRNWNDSHADSGFAKPGSPLHKSINDVDFPTSVLILHIATDILYFKEDTDSDQQMKKMSRDLSNYVMYLVFKCGVMLTSSTELLHNKAHKEMDRMLERHINRGEKKAMIRVYEAYKGLRPPIHSSQPVNQIQLLKNTSKYLVSPLLPRACDVAQELTDIHREEDCWGFVAAVWAEMLYYIAPRCGGAFHSEHLPTGGEFITHVLLLMRLLGPFLPPPGA